MRALHGHRVPRIAEFSPAVGAHPVSVTVNGEHVTQVGIMTAENEIKYTQRQI